MQAAFDAIRRKVWATQPKSFFEQAILEADGTFSTTDAECKQGIDINYKGEWGYHRLLLTLANTGEVLRVVNRSGNRPSHEGAAAQFDATIQLCRDAGFHKILLRGDTDFSQTTHLDGWHAAGDVMFVFGYDKQATLQRHVDELPTTAWQKLKRPAKYSVNTQPRPRPTNEKERGFKALRLHDDDVAEFRYQPTACRRAYRMVVLRKWGEVNDPQQARLFMDCVYFYYITNEEQSSAAEIVFSANDRCQQVNLLAQLHGSRALHSPERQASSDRERLLGLEFRTFVNYIVRVPAQVVKSGRQLIVRLLAWNDWQPVFLRLAERLSTALTAPRSERQRC